MKEFENKEVIIRCDKAGVFFCKYLKPTNDGKNLLLTNARKIYRWQGANTVEDLALKGLQNNDYNKVTKTVDLLEVDYPVQVIPCTKEAIKNLNRIEVWSY